MTLLQGLLPPRRRGSPADVPTCSEGDPAPLARQSSPQPCQQSPIGATKGPCACAGLLRMGGTGLEPVTPSLSIRSSVRARSLRCAQRARLSGIRRATERLSERERTLNLAILATARSPRGWCLSRNTQSARGSPYPTEGPYAESNGGTPGPAQPESFRPSPPAPSLCSLLPSAPQPATVRPHQLRDVADRPGTWMPSSPHPGACDSADDMKNWAGNLTYSTDCVLAPRSIAEAQSMVAQA